MSFNPDSTREGQLPPWEIAKVVAFDVVITQIEGVTGESVAGLLGQRKDEFIAENVLLKGGGRPSARAVRDTIARSKQPGWFPGQPHTHSPGRPCQITEHQKDGIAHVAMDQKANIQMVSKTTVIARLPRLTINKATGLPISRWTFNRIFATRCFDENEDDPWQFLVEGSQDYLPVELKSRRVDCANHILEIVPQSAWSSHVAIDPCKSLLAKTVVALAEQKHSALRKARWMSKKSRKKGTNLRTSKTVKTQASSAVLKVHWTPIYARGKVRIYMVDPQEVANDPSLPLALNDSAELAKFVQHVLPAELSSMAEEFGWSTKPRVLVHDKASYMVNNATALLNTRFGEAVNAAGMRSWLGDTPATWLAPRFGDVYLHETVISHIRRLLDTRFTCTHINETPKQFRKRLNAVQDHMNSEDFSAKGKAGLTDLAKSMRARCEEVVSRQGDRIPK